MGIGAGQRFLTALDLLAQLLWLASKATGRLALLPCRLGAMPARRILARLNARVRLERNPLFLELRDIVLSPASMRLAEMFQGYFKWLLRTLDSSKAARRLFLALALLAAFRLFIYEEELPRGSWISSGSCVASYYDKGFLGKPTANGEIFSPYEMTAAHRTLPFNTYLKLRNPANGAEAIVRVNDRGPFVAGRDLDLSRAAAKALGIYHDGLGRLELRILRKSP